MREDAIARRFVLPWPWLVSVVRQRVGEIISVMGRVRDAVVWSLKTGHSRRVHIEDREHERGLRELVCDLAANVNLHDLSSATEQGEIWVASDHG
jgi:hypothetical protein